VKFRCERDVLIDALSTAGRAVTGRGGALPVLSGVRVDIADGRLRVVGSDLDLTIRTEVEVAAGEGGSTVLPSRLINEIMRSLDPGAVDIEIDGEEARISAGRSQFTVRTLPVDDFPHLPEPSGEEVSVSAADLSAGLRQVVMAASGDDARPILTGVLLTAEEGGLRLVATDSYRLAVRDLPDATVLGEGQKVLVPSRALGELIRVLGQATDVKVRLGERDVTFDVDPGNGASVQLNTRLIEGEFPNYRQLIPASYPNELTVDREVFLDAVRRVKLMAREATPLRLTQREGSLELMAVTQDVGEAHEEVDAVYNGTELTVAFNPDYLIAGIEAAPGDEVKLQTVDALKPAVLRATEGSDYLYLLMPVRVS
jgi:DNA polymerase-3 subunit beta